MWDGRFYAEQLKDFSNCAATHYFLVFIVLWFIPIVIRFFMQFIKHQFLVLKFFFQFIFSRVANLGNFLSLILYLQDGEEVVYDMDIEILDSYPTIEILGTVLYTTQVLRSRKLTKLQYSALTQCTNIGTIRYFSQTYTTIDALRNPVTSKSYY